MALMEPLVRVGGVDPAHHALLWDRVAVGEDRPQRWGSQGTSGEGRSWQPFPVEK
jgi:hypothetical protein